MEQAKVSHKTSVAKLAGFITAVLQREDAVKLVAMNDTAIAKAVRAIGLASERNGLAYPTTIETDWHTFEDGTRVMKAEFTVNR
ncbi:stage V sporulation protein S [Alicyclobacillus sendaiensis]|uniref:stage V sporulation protein S n=1 Tax=Alicyclobacillus sendaiensis TaxID=192387 RepID=UPI0026F430CE|nr:stage V sporulation protein S [Alicyclobacillus sendaiensis]